MRHATPSGWRVFAQAATAVFSISFLSLALQPSFVLAGEGEAPHPAPAVESPTLITSVSATVQSAANVVVNLLRPKYGEKD